MIRRADAPHAKPYSAQPTEGLRSHVPTKSCGSPWRLTTNGLSSPFPKARRPLSRAVAERFREEIYGLIPLLERGRAERRSERPLPASTESSVIGALATLISRSVVAGEAAELSRLLPDFAEFSLTPYLGTDEAHSLAIEAT